jgi:HTH-type transcriptional regulator/antitoxin HigA
MDKKKNGLYRDLIIHPGETLKEVLEIRDMSQKELSIRTDVTETHVSNIIRGKKGISVSYSKKLEYALSIDASFWINLQSIFDQELNEYEEENGITKEELSKLKNLKQIIKYLKELKYLEKEVDGAPLVIQIRKLLNISSLLRIPDITETLAYRLSERVKVDYFVLFAWLKICDLEVEKRRENIPLNINLLKEKIPVLKSLMFKNEESIREGLEKNLEDCGINFLLIPHFEGAPVQGVIKLNKNGSLNLIMTNRQKFADIFWFTFFHEIGHIINGDISNKFIDYESEENEKEKKADLFSSRTLINHKEYEDFIRLNDFSIDSVESFSSKLKIPSFILIGRLQKDKYLKYSDFYSHKKKYKFFAM